MKRFKANDAKHYICFFVYAMNVATEAIGYTASVVTTLSCVPQVYQVYRTKTARDVSTTFMTSIITGLGLWLTYGVLINNYPLIGANAVSMALYSSILGMKYYYAHKYPDQNQTASVPPATDETPCVDVQTIPGDIENNQKNEIDIK